jgi:TonB-dependent starch-binding outer membrane protein SusC
VKKLWVCLIVAFVLFSFDKIQERNISGTITSAEDQSPMPGVNVIIKGTKTGTTSYAQGKYQIVVPSKRNTLIFSFIGYKSQKVNIGVNTTIDVALKVDEEALNELIITGY